MKLYRRKAQDPAPVGQPDPYMIQSGGKFYVYATHEDGVQLYTAPRIDGAWTCCGLCFRTPGRKGYWAPAVLERDGVFYMYVSAQPEASEDAHDQALMVAAARSPEGPFTYVRDLLPPFSIDAHVFDYRGQLYLLYSTNETHGARPGTYIALDRMVSPTEAEGKPVAAVRPTLDEEIFCRNRFRPGEDWHTVEGAFYFHENGTHFITYSGSAYGRPTYFIGYSVAHGECGDLRQLRWQKYPDDQTYCPLIAANEFVEGTGHNSIIRDGGRYYIVYHGRDRGEGNPEGDYRTMRADRLYVDGDQLSVQVTP